MYNNNEVISYLQANKILALKLDHAVSSVGEKVRNQVDALGKGATACCITRPVSPMNTTMFASSKRQKICASGMLLYALSSMVTLSLKCFGSTLRKYSNTKLMLN